MSRHLNGSVKPWEWGDVPLAWQEWVLISLDVQANLNTPPEKG